MRDAVLGLFSSPPGAPPDSAALPGGGVAPDVWLEWLAGAYEVTRCSHAAVTRQSRGESRRSHAAVTASSASEADDRPRSERSQPFHGSKRHRS